MQTKNTRTKKNRPITKDDVLDWFRLICEEYGEAMEDSNSEARITLWYNALQQYPYELVNTAIANVFLNSVYKPRLANVSNEVKRLQSVSETSDEQLWEELTATFREVEHNADGYKYTACDDNGVPEWKRCLEANRRIYENLSPTLKEYVRNVDELVELARKEGTDLNVEKAMFKKRIVEIRARERLRNETSPGIIALAANSIPQIGSKSRNTQKQIGGQVNTRD